MGCKRDAEAAFDSEYAQLCGINLDKLAFLEPKSANDVLEAVRILASNSDIDLIVIDSVAAMVPEEEYDKDVGKGMIGSLARLMSSALKQLAILASKNKCTIVFLNQERASNMLGYGPKTTTTGGSSLTYYSSVRIDLNRASYVENSAGDKLGLNIVAQTVKNKTHTPFKKAEYSILFPHEENGEMIAGVDIMGDVINQAINLEIIVKAGSWLSYKETIKVQGLEKLRAKLASDPVLYDEIYSLVLHEVKP